MCERVRVVAHWIREAQIRKGDIFEITVQPTSDKPGPEKPGQSAPAPDPQESEEKEKKD